MRHQIGSTIFIIVFALGWSAITCAFDAVITGALIRSLMAATYPTVQGTVTSSRIIETPGDDGPTYTAEVRYMYLIGGREFAGQRIRSESMSSSKRFALETVGRYPAGASVAVHHSPRDPGFAMLEPAPSGLLLYSIVFSTPFNAVMLGMWAIAVHRIRTKRRNPPAGGLKIIELPGLTRLRVHTTHPLTAGLIGAGLAGFMLAFILGFATEMDPPRWASMAAMGLILSVGLGAAVHSKLTRTSRERFIEIDEGEGVVRIPTCRRLRWSGEAIPLQSVSEVSTETTRNGDSTETTLEFALTDRRLVSLPARFGHDETRSIAVFLTERIAAARRME